MRKWFYYAGIIVLLLQASAGYAQIPGARQQPQWAMPFFFEDANGEKDTVWIGYDTKAMKLANGPDSNYEYFNNKDSGKFQAALWTSYNYPLGSFDDSTKKVEVTSDITNQIEIGFLNGKMPVTMKWVDSLLNSDSLPFPDISPRPRARVNMICSNGEPGYLYCHLGSLYYAFLLTNYYHPQWSYPHVYADSFVFDGSGNISAEQAISVDIQIVPHNDPIPVGIEDPELMGSSIKLNPNPVQQTLYVQGIPKSGWLILTDVQGRIAMRQFLPAGDATVNMQSLVQGFYVFTMQDATGIIYHRDKVMVGR